jgi:protein-tyrosine-phosphatase
VVALRPPRSTFDVVFVCTGNRYRSVLAEAAFRDATKGLPVRTGSFGTLEIGAAPPPPEAVMAARGFGLDISSHAARCVRGTNLSAASLVIGFEGFHLTISVADADAPPERTFMLNELVELLAMIEPPVGAEPTARAAELVVCADRLRRTEASGLPIEIADPVGQPARRQQAIGQHVYAAAMRLAAQLFGSPSGHPTGGD